MVKSNQCARIKTLESPTSTLIGCCHCRLIGQANTVIESATSNPQYLISTQAPPSPSSLPSLLLSSLHIAYSTQPTRLIRLIRLSNSVASFPNFKTHQLIQNDWRQIRRQGQQRFKERAIVSSRFPSYSPLYLRLLTRPNLLHTHLGLIVEFHFISSYIC